MTPSLPFQVTPFTETQATGSSCFLYDLYDSLSATAVALPSFLTTYTYPSGSVYYNSGGYVGTAGSQTFSYNIRGRVNLASGGAIVFQPLSFKLNHECSVATITGNAGDIISYTVMNA